MEASGYFIGGHYRAGNPQYSPEKQGKVGGGDHFVVEDLLDFSNEEEDESAGLVEGPFDRAAENLTVESCSNSFSGDLVCRSLAEANISDDICEPHDELEELEWLSNFVEDSFSSEDIQKLHLISGINPSSSSSSEIQCNTANIAGDSPPLFPSANPLPGKARSKRSRASPSSWASRLLLLSPTRDSTFPSPESELLTSPPTSSYKKISKAGKTKEPSMADGRRCRHCATDKTPQWRTGPTGPKTLCNACGVRFKSGRLVPEYRPAASPTFVTSRHSNSHRKVLELRRQKEVVEHHQHQHHRRRHQELIHPGIVYDGVSGDEFLIHHRIGSDFSQLF